jgi:hypothetical protein
VVLPPDHIAGATIAQNPADDWRQACQQQQANMANQVLFT